MVSRRRYRGRGRSRLRVYLVLVALIAGAGGLLAIGRAAYLTGQALATTQVRSLETERDKLSAALTATETQRDSVKIRLTETSDALAALKRRYDKDVPTGAPAELYGLVRDRLAAGLPAERLRQVILGADVVRVCEGRTTRRRIAIQAAPARAGDLVPFLDGLIGLTVTSAASGAATGGATGGATSGSPGGTTGGAAPATSAAGDNSVQGTTISIYAAWMDKPIVLNGLPVKHDLLLNNALLRIVVEPADLRGYVTATLSSCLAKTS